MRDNPPVGPLDRALSGLHSAYRLALKERAKAEMRLLAVPNSDREKAVAIATGQLQGLSKAIEIIEKTRAANELPLDGGAA